MIERSFWKGRRVLITGHTGFKGAWLALWLSHLGADVTGIALPPNTTPSLFALTSLESTIGRNVFGDIRNLGVLTELFKAAAPSVVFHLAAQPLVLESYRNPVETFETNVLGTVNVLEACRSTPGIRGVVVVTTDKCYENKEWCWGYREDDRLGGFDPYSNSKACAELVAASYRSSFFNPRDYDRHGVALATARAGNVIGGGDWAENRLIPDCIRAFLRREAVTLRNPHSTRPWQHVLEPLAGYLMLAERLVLNGPQFGEAWNFGPDPVDVRPVEEVVRFMSEAWFEPASYIVDPNPAQPHEARSLTLDCSKARALLKWRAVWTLEDTLKHISEWTADYAASQPLRETCFRQIRAYENALDAIAQ